jgi:hypothetical protein
MAPKPAEAKPAAVNSGRTASTPSPRFGGRPFLLESSQAPALSRVSSDGKLGVTALKPARS